MLIMLAMLAVFYAIVVAILYISQQKTAPTFDEYAVGGRSYGPWYVAMSYVNSWWPGSTFIAFFGLAAGAGVFGLYGLAYSSLGVAMMYFMATRAWRWGKKYDLRSQPDLLGKRFDSSAVKVIASVIGIVSLFPWVVLGMQALGTVFEIASDGAWSVTTCLLVGLAVIVIRQYWTVRMGMRGLIMTDAFQGTVAYVFSAIVCVVLLSGAAGSPISFADLNDVADKYLVLPGDGDSYGPLYIFALIFTGVIGSLCWPTSFQRIYTASSVRSVKSGTLCTVLISGVFYTLLMLVGIAATGLPDVAAAPQGGWFSIMSDYGGTWMLGLGVTIVFAASMGHIDGSVQVCGLQIANDLVNTEKRPLSDKQLTFVAKTSMAVFMVLAGVVAYATFNMERLQLLAQISYQGVVQLAVPLFLGIFWRGGNKQGAVAGMVVGFVVAMVLTWIYPDDIRGLGSLTGGIVGIAVNLAIFLGAAAFIKSDDAEKARVDDMFAAAKTSVKAPLPVHDESMDGQLHELAKTSREQALDG
ncbi:sodium:solute symporter family protein [Mycolicibacterium vaccae]|uniref:Sodium:solute symporter family protein n=2 Tax=Mycolicibacterium vaccae TaxID=1810 RepID=K0VNI1_MYCVA|nr:sodium:solute symporter family protein [Mycolicibacterium vaccae]ANI41014.1 sodium:solute symporter [Mycolicibacterium vaccae 95051]EJZ12769.1 sodium:solute symporter family protein [Mycolicibacterium vaccae ATCC 25954]